MNAVLSPPPVSRPRKVIVCAPAGTAYAPYTTSAFAIAAGRMVATT